MKNEQKLIELFLIDDDKDDVLFFQEVLKEQSTSLNLTISTDGEDALQELLDLKDRKYCPDLILLDLRMPKLDGLEFLAKIKHDEFLLHIPVVIMSDSDCPQIIKKAYKLHASGFIRKPQNLRDYEETIKNFGKWWASTVLLPRRISNDKQDILQMTV